MGAFFGTVGFILFAGLAVHLGIAAIGLALSRSGTMNRAEYAIRVGVLICLFVATGSLLDEAIRDGVLGFLTLACVGVTAWWTGLRIRHIGGMSKWWGLLVGLPGLGIVPVIIFMLLPTRLGPVPPVPPESAA